MLDRHARPYFNPIFAKSAEFFIEHKVSANQITFIALGIGLLAGLVLYLGIGWLSILLLWLSGYLDAVDGEVARMQNTANPFGAQLDIVFDRIVELSIVWALAFRFPEARLALVILCSAILISMTIFLTSGQVLKKPGKKSFYYQAGLMERTEGFIAFTFMILLPAHLTTLTLIYALLIFFTAGQRIWEAYTYFRD